MRQIFALFCFLTFFNLGKFFSQDEIVNSVNKDASATWTAKKYDVDFGQVLMLSTERHHRGRNIRSFRHDIIDRRSIGRSLFRLNHNSSEVIPDEFDVRDEWENCTSMNFIHDQGKCVTSWAIAVASAASDRLCIKNANNNNDNNNIKTIRLSSANLISCLNHGNCRTGQTLTNAWTYIARARTATEDCQPYPDSTVFSSSGFIQMWNSWRLG